MVMEMKESWEESRGLISLNNTMEICFIINLFPFQIPLQTSYNFCFALKRLILYNILIIHNSYNNKIRYNMVHFLFSSDSFGSLSSHLQGACTAKSCVHSLLKHGLQYKILPHHLAYRSSLYCWGLSSGETFTRGVLLLALLLLFEPSSATPKFF